MIRDFVTIFGVIAGFSYYVLTVRNAQRNQQHQLETRQAQLFMQIYDRFTTKEFQLDYRTLAVSDDWTDYDDFIQNIRGLENVIPIIREIRETWNGKGYPSGLFGEQISTEARLIALVDAYQALISTRPNRKKLRKEEAIKELQKEAGKKFDPKMVQDFLQILL